MTVPIDRQADIAANATRIRDLLALGTASTQPTSAFATAAQGDKADSAIQSTDKSSIFAANKVLTPRDYFGYPTVDISAAEGVLFIADNPGAQDVHSVRIDRSSNYNGGVFGWLNSALRINSDINGQGVSFEAGLTVAQNNHANVGSGWDTTPQHHAVGFQANRYGTAPIWSLVLEAIDRTGNSDPVSGQIGIELDITANGTDTNINRQGISIIIGRPGDVNGNFTGAAATCGVGLMLTRQGIDSANNRFGSGISFGDPRASKTDFDVGLDFIGGTFQIGVARIPTGAHVVWQRTDYSTDPTHRTLTYIEAGYNALRYAVGDGHVFDFRDNGMFNITAGISVFGRQVITGTRTGWSASTGTATRTSFDTSSVTTQQLAERVKALVDDLITHGLIGA